jgi:hypothetical protein
MSDWNSDDLWSDVSTSNDATGWPEAPAQSNTQDDTWSEANDTDWGEPTDYWNETSNEAQDVVQNPVSQNNTSPANAKPIGTKTLAFGVLGIGIVIALVILFISRIDISKKEPASTAKPQTNTQTQVQADIGLTEVTGVDSNTEYTLSGTIHDKVYYAANNQVLCGIKIKMEFGSESQIWTYYCAYNIYKQENIGDTEQVTYSKPNDKFIMIHGVSK